MPSFVRAVVILFVILRKPEDSSAMAPRRMAAGCFLLAPRGAFTNLQILLALQFTKRRMRMFITMPSARNMNSTDDPP